MTDLEAVQSRTTTVGAIVTESTQESCTIEGPEGLLVRAFSSVIGNSSSDEQYLSSLLCLSSELNENNDTDVDGEDDSTVHHALVNRRSFEKMSLSRPQFNSLDVTLFTNIKQTRHKKSEFIPCIPNSKPTPFETDVSFILSVYVSSLRRNIRPELVILVYSCLVFVVRLF